MRPSLTCAAILFALVSTVSLNARALAQDSNTQSDDAAKSFEGLVPFVQPGDLVTVVGSDGVRTKGKVIDLKAASIAIATGSQGKQRTYPAIDVTRIVQRDSVTNGIKKGAIIGGISFLALGLLAHAAYASEGTAGGVGPILAAAGIGAAGGAAVGWGLDAATGNHVVFENRQTSSSSPAIAREHTPEFFGGISAGRTDQFRTPHFSASAGVGLRFASGVSIEFEAAHSLKGVTHPNTCVVVSRYCCPCAVGVPFKVGLESLGTATVQIRYTYQRWRVQPFVSAGIGVVSISTNSIINQPYSATSEALPVGVGVRLPITRSFAIRPELSYYFREGPAIVRAGVGVVYQWK